MTNLFYIDEVFVEGEKGGSTETYTPTEVSTTVQANTYAKLVDLLCEGEIGGPANNGSWLQSIYYNEIPIQNANGTYNYEGIRIEYLHGTNTQPYLTTAEGIQNTTNLNRIPITTQSDPSQPIGGVNSDIDTVRFTISIPVLMHQNTNGDIKKGKIELEFFIQADNGAGVKQSLGRQIIYEKFTSEYRRQYTVENLKSYGPSPWVISIHRITPDSTTTKDVNACDWYSYTTIINAKLNYYERAVIGHTINGQQFGNQVPSRAYKINGRKIRYPNNYNPQTHTYIGDWGGTFTTGVTNNPAWIVYDLLTDPDIGLGSVVNDDMVDKWTLYACGAYCDGMVTVTNSSKNNNGSYSTTTFQEPRFTFNGIIETRAQALEVIVSMCSVMRAYPIWIGGQISFVQDRPITSPARPVSPSNVSPEGFSYTGVPKRNRSSVVKISWNNPDTLGKLDVIELVDEQSIIKFGYNEVDYAAYGCNSRTEAIRRGKHVLDTNINAKESISFKGGLEFADAIPGELIAVNDPNYAGLTLEGRVISATSTSLVLDKTITIAAGSVATIQTPYVSGGVCVEAFERSISNSGTTSTLNFASVPMVPKQGAMVVISSPSLETRKFALISVKENGEWFDVTGIEYDENKYARIDSGIVGEVPVTTIFSGSALTPPTNITAQGYTYTEGDKNVRYFGIQMSWTNSTDARTTYYEIQYKPSNGGWVPLAQTTSSSYDWKKVEGDIYDFRIRAVGVGIFSEWIELVDFLLDDNLTGLLPPTNVDTLEGNGIFNSRDCTIVWSPSAGHVYDTNNVGDSSVKGYKVEVYKQDQTTLLRSITTAPDALQYTYTYTSNQTDNGLAKRDLYFKVFTVDHYAVVSDTYGSTTAHNPVPAAPTGLETDDGGTVWGSKDCKIHWTAPSDIDLSHFKVVVMDSDTTVLRTVYTPSKSETSYSYFYEDNHLDHNNTPNRTIRFRVYSVDDFDDTTTNYAELIATNPPPDLSNTTINVVPGPTYINVNWAKVPDNDLDFYEVFWDTANPPVANSVSVSRTAYLDIFDLDFGTNYYFRVYPYDLFGVGIPSIVVTGTPTLIPAESVNIELVSSITMSDADGNNADILAKLYDGVTDSDGITYSGGWKWIEVDFGMAEFINGIQLWTATATQVCIAYKRETEDSWSWLSGNASHILVEDNHQLRLSNQTSEANAKTNYWLTDPAFNYAFFPNGEIARYCRLYVNASSAKTIYEMVFRRIVIAEDIATESLSAISANIGNITTGTIQSQNYMSSGGTEGMKIDASNGTIVGEITFLANSHGYDNALADLDPATSLKLSTVEEGATRNQYLGNWITNHAYKVGDLVLFDNNGWICILAHTSNGTVNDPPTYPVESNTWWSIYTIQGADGTPGEPGQDGADGADGTDGINGTPGVDGEDGVSTYVHYAYATSANGSANFSLTYTGNETYVGWLTDNTLADSNNYQDYEWSLFKGSDGIDGADGTDGINGTPGVDGEDGISTYIHYAYSSSSNGYSNFSTTYTGVQTYVGLLVDHNVADSNNYQDYEWSLFKGADGADGTDGTDGAPGTPGEDGITRYIHYAYATNSTGSTGFSTTYTGTETYVGWLVDTSVNDSTNYRDYEWSLFKGSDGSDGSDGTDGATGATGATGPQGPSVVLTSSKAVSFTATDGTLDGSQANIVFTATTSGVVNPTYAWSQSGCQYAPTGSTSSTYTVTSANFGTSKSAIVTCTVSSSTTSGGPWINKTTIVRLEKSSAAAGADKTSNNPQSVAWLNDAGGLALLDKVAKTDLDETVIVGGVIKTGLVTSVTIGANKIITNSANIDTAKIVTLHMMNNVVTDTAILYETTAVSINGYTYGAWTLHSYKDYILDTIQPEYAFTVYGQAVASVSIAISNFYGSLGYVYEVGVVYRWEVLRVRNNVEALIYYFNDYNGSAARITNISTTNIVDIKTGGIMMYGLRAADSSQPLASGDSLRVKLFVARNNAGSTTTTTGTVACQLIQIVGYKR